MIQLTSERKASLGRIIWVLFRALKEAAAESRYIFIPPDSVEVVSPKKIRFETDPNLVNLRDALRRFAITMYHLITGESELNRPSFTTLSAYQEIDWEHWPLLRDMLHGRVFDLMEIEKAIKPKFFLWRWLDALGSMLLVAILWPVHALAAIWRGLIRPLFSYNVLVRWLDRNDNLEKITAFVLFVLFLSTIWQAVRLLWGFYLGPYVVLWLGVVSLVATIVVFAVFLMPSYWYFSSKLISRSLGIIAFLIFSYFWLFFYMADGPKKEGNPYVKTASFALVDQKTEEIKGLYLMDHDSPLNFGPKWFNLWRNKLVKVLPEKNQIIITNVPTGIPSAPLIPISVQCAYIKSTDSLILLSPAGKASRWRSEDEIKQAVTSSVLAATTGVCEAFPSALSAFTTKSVSLNFNAGIYTDALPTTDTLNAALAKLVAELNQQVVDRRKKAEAENQHYQQTALNQKLAGLKLELAKKFPELAIKVGK